MSTWQMLCDLSVEIDDYSLEPLQATVSSDFERKSTVIRLRGVGEEGLGEDVTYDAVDHDILQAAGANLPLAGRFTLGSFCEHLATLSLFPQPPQREVSARYRTWAYESAALDLALRQARRAAARGARARAAAGALRRLDAPRRAAVDRAAAQAAWRCIPCCASSSTRPARGTSALIAELVGTGAVDSVDFKGLYHGSIVDQPPGPGALPPCRRRLPRRLDRGPGADR